MKIFRKTIDALGGRKFVLALSGVLAVVIQAVSGVELDKELVNKVILLAGGYIGTEGIIDAVGAYANAAYSDKINEARKDMKKDEEKEKNKGE